MRSSLCCENKLVAYENGNIMRIKNGVEVQASISKTKNGYGVVSYYDAHGRQHHPYVHRIIAALFIPNPNNFTQVNHKDGNKLNNSFENLEWVSPRDNMNHAFKTGLINLMKNAKPCRMCGKLTRSRDEVCDECRKLQQSERKRLRKKEERIRKYSRIGLDRLSETQLKYLNCAIGGMTISEIAKKFNVSRQCVSESLLRAENCPRP